MLSTANTSVDGISNPSQTAFLQRFATDDQFRAELQANPSSALAEYGIQVDTEQLPENVSLPEADSVQYLLKNDGENDIHQTVWFFLFG